jgi:hypothetical protein
MLLIINYTGAASSTTVVTTADVVSTARTTAAAAAAATAGKVWQQSTAGHEFGEHPVTRRSFSSSSGENNISTFFNGYSAFLSFTWKKRSSDKDVY